jgi:L-lysine 2,3-aminomutase
LESTVISHSVENVCREPAEPAWQRLAWQRLLKDAIRDARQLCRAVGLSAADEEAAVRAAQDFPVFAPRGYVDLMRPGDPRDPLLTQVLPRAEELAEAPGFTSDPVGDAAATRMPGLLTKYAGRALLVATGACAIHCRYCFRRHFPYGEGPRSLADWAPALDEIAADRSLDEVILSGGDPLMLADVSLAKLAERLADIDHLQRLRIHTRLPIVLPERVCDELLGWLGGTRLTPIVVVHANHPAELSPAVLAALGRMVMSGIVTLNQSVLLRGVNDDADVLTELCRRLVDARVMPYYLHQLDRVRGAAHFEVPEAVGRRLMGELRARLPGYAVPRYVRETAGAGHKVSLA